MKKLVLLLIGAVVVVAFLAPVAQAGYVGTTAANNDIIGVKEGWFGANLYLWAGAETQIRVEYIGKEASYLNTFYLNGLPVITNATNSYVDTGLYSVSPGLLDFSFLIPGGATVVNGANRIPDAVPNFFLSLGSAANFMGDAVGNGTPSSGTTVIIALDDGGAGPDDNHDDMVMRLTVTGGEFYVPDGGTTAMLLGGALLGLGALRRKFRA